MAQVERHIRNFDQAASFLGGKLRRKIAHNTYVEQGGCDRIDVILHSTPVVTYYRNGQIALRDGGWQTVTTQDRINKLSPYSVGSDGRGGWDVYGPNDSAQFENGMMSDADGRWQGHKARIFERRRAMSNRLAPWDIW